MLLQYENGSSCVNIWKQYLKTGRKISWTAQINYNSAIQVINGDQIKYLPPQLNWNSGFYSSQYMVKPSKRVVQTAIPPPTRHPLLSIFMTQSKLKRAQQTFMLEIKIQNYLHPPLLRGGFKRRTERCDRYCREILLELKLIQGLNHSKDGVAWVTIIVLINRNKSLKRKKAVSSQFLYLQA